MESFYKHYFVLHNLHMLNASSYTYRYMLNPPMRQCRLNYLDVLIQTPLSTLGADSPPLPLRDVRRDFVASRASIKNLASYHQNRFTCARSRRAGTEWYSEESQEPIIPRRRNLRSGISPRGVGISTRELGTLTIYRVPIFISTFVGIGI